MKSVHKELAREVLAAYERMREKEPEIIEKNIPRGTSIIHQDQPINHVFIILSGKMKTHFDTPKGTEFLVAVEGEGVFVGEVEALTNEPATCSVTALTESKVAVIQQKTYQRRLDDDHSFALLMNRIVTCRLQLMTKRAAIHLSYPLEYSVLKLLETTVHSSGRTVSVSKEGIANYFGTSIRSINRILKELQNKGILSPSTQIEIESMEALEQALRLYDEQY